MQCHKSKISVIAAKIIDSLEYYICFFIKHIKLYLSLNICSFVYPCSSLQNLNQQIFCKTLLSLGQVGNKLKINER